MTFAIVVHEHGGAGSLSWERVDLRDPGPGEVRLAQSCAGLNFIDVYHRTGYYAQSVPFIPGVEGAGTIEAVGEGVTDFKIGDRVAYAGPLGAYAEKRVIAADRLVKLPPDISFEQAAALMLQGMTARVLLKQAYAVKPDDWILIHAAAGGTGIIMCQWAAALGARVIGTVSSEEKAEFARVNGCHHTINYKKVDFVSEVSRITGGQKVSAVFDSVGRDTFLRSLDCLRVNGTMVTFGQSSGPVDPIAPVALSQKGSLVLVRPFLFHFIDRREDLEAAADDVFSVVRSGTVHVRIGAMFPLCEAAKAHAALEGRTTTGSIVMKI